MPVGLSLILVVFFLLMNAFFVMAEFALVRVRRSQVDMLVEEGRAGAKNAQRISRDVNAYLSACQLGITIASLALGWLGEPAVSALFHPAFAYFGVPESASHAISVAIGFCIVTTLHIVVGELIPKSMAIFSTERYALMTSTPLVWFYRLTFPVMLLFNGITNGVVRLMGHDPANEHDVYTEEEIRLLIDESTESGLINSEQNEFVDNVFDIADTDVDSLMTPRRDMVCLCLEDGIDENLRIVDNHKYTRYPVFRKDKDDIVGFVHIKDLYDLTDDASMDDLTIRRIVAVPEGMPVVKLLQLLKSEHTKIAIVVDEHGGTSGLVTMGDIIEEIIGEYDDEYSHGTNDDDLQEVEPNHFMTTGACPIDDFAERMGFDPDDFPEYETLGGLLLEAFDRIPGVGDETAYTEGGTDVFFTVKSMDGRRIGQVELFVVKEEVDEEK